MPEVSIDTREGFLGITCTNCDVTEGVTIREVVDKDLCARAGLRSGMVITMINGTCVGGDYSGHDFALELMNEAKEKEQKLKITYLTPDEAAEMGARERRSRMRFCMGIVAIVVAILLAFVLAVFLGVVQSPAEMMRKQTQEAQRQQLKNDTAERQQFIDAYTNQMKAMGVEWVGQLNARAMKTCSPIASLPFACGSMEMLKSKIPGLKEGLENKVGEGAKQ